MTERIYTYTVEGNLEALEETPFSTEDELQALIAEHPELLDGEQIRPGDARRWILITREKGIAASSGEGTRWSVDHLIVDQDAVPTLVEVKRGSNPEIRRSIVGQMLDYAAHASETWTASELRSAFESQTANRGLDPDNELATLLQGYDEPDVEGFWQDVATNLAARRLRLLFVADEIPDPLAQVITFLNAQMPGIEVLAVEVKRFHGGTAQTLVPRVIGRTVSGSDHGRSRSAPKLTHQSFLEGFASEEVRGVAERLMEATEQSGGYVYYGTGGVSIRVNCSIRRQHVSVAWLYPRPAIGWMRTRDFSFGAAIFEDDPPEELLAALEPWIDKFAEDDFTEDVSSKGTRAWAVSHQAAVQQQDLLVDRLRGMVSELAAL